MPSPTMLEIDKIVETLGNLPQEQSSLSQSISELQAGLARMQQEYELVQIELIPRQLPGIEAKIRESLISINKLSPIVQHKFAGVNDFNLRISKRQALKQQIVSKINRIAALKQENSDLNQQKEKNHQAIVSNTIEIQFLSSQRPNPTAHVDVIVPHGGHVDIIHHQPQPQASMLHSRGAHYATPTPTPQYAGHIQQQQLGQASMLHMSSPYSGAAMQHRDKLMQLNSNNVFLISSNNRLDQRITDNISQISGLQNQLYAKDDSLGVCTLEQLEAAINADSAAVAPLKIDYDVSNAELLQLQGNQAKLKAHLIELKSLLNQCKSKHPEGQSQSFTKESDEVLEAKSLQFSRDISSSQKAINQKQDRLRELALTLSNNAGNLLIYSPDTLLLNYAERLRTKFKEFENTYPVNQSKYVRRCLALVQYKIDHIGDPSRRDSIAAQRLAFYQLWGMISSFSDYMHSQGNAANAPKKYSVVTNAFIELLTSLQNYSIHRDRLVYFDDRQSNHLYSYVLSQNVAYIRDLSLEELDNYESVEFSKAVTIYSATISTITTLPVENKLQQQVKNVLTEVYQALAELKPEMAREQYKFFTKILLDVDQAIKATVTNSATSTAEDKTASLKILAALKKYDIPGAPSFWKKIIGAALIILGALTAVVFAKATTFSLGVLAPWSVPGIAAGGTTALAGAGLFYSGRQIGLARAVANIQAELNDKKLIAHASPPPYSQVQRV
jgi:hypothetical protein